MLVNHGENFRVRAHETAKLTLYDEQFSGILKSVTTAAVVS